jgi:hypothetical protein
MMPRPQGNGSGKFEIDVTDMGGWIRVYPSKAEYAYREDFGVYLSRTMVDWFRQRPQLRVKCIVPINREGSTVELHAWFEVHLLPSAPQAPQPGGPQPE